MLTRVARESQSAWSRATLPVRARSPASTMTATSGSSCGSLRTRSTRGRKARNGGIRAPAQTATGMPTRSAMGAVGSDAPPAAQPWGGVVERGHAARSFLLVAVDRNPSRHVAKVASGRHPCHRREPKARILHLALHERHQLLLDLAVQAVRALAHASAR